MFRLSNPFRGRGSLTLIRNGPRYQSDEATKPQQGYNFAPTEDQMKISELVSRFATEELVPKNKHYDRTGEFPWPELKKLWEMGCLNPLIPTKYGGPGLKCMDHSLIIEELGYGCAGFATAAITNTLATIPFLKRGTEEQNKKWLGRLVKEPLIASLAVTEPSGGSDVAGCKTKAVKKGDDWVINGQKMWITGAGQASFIVLMARTDLNKKSAKSKAFTCFVVDKDTPGLIIGKKENMMGQKCSDTRGITFDNMIVPNENVIGQVGDGFKIIMHTFDGSRPLIAANCVGLAQRALDEATPYAMTRKAFGSAIANFQAVGIMLTDIAVDVDLGRLAYKRAAWDVDRGVKSNFHSSVSKLFCSQMANRAAHNCIQIFGGSGYSEDLPAAKLARDARIFEIYEGTTQIQQVVIGRELVNRFRDHDHS